MTENEVRDFCADQMKAQRLTYLRMSDELYINRHTLSDWIHGRANFPVDGLVRLLDLMGYELRIVRKGR